LTVTCHRLNVLVTAVALTGVVVPGLVAAQQPEVATTVAFTEGPTVDRDGNVYFTEMVSLRIMKLTPKGVLSTFRERSNNANGLLVDPQGRLVACEGSQSQRTGVPVTFKPQITRTDLRTGVMQVLADNYQGKPFVGRTMSRSTARAGCTSPI
jgi:gluconolactonase